MSIYSDFIILYDDDNNDIPELDISASVISDIAGSYGSFNPSAVDFLAGVGTVSFDLRNDGQLYTSITIGRRVDIRVTNGGRTKNVFSGKVSPTTIDSGEWGERRVHVVLEDWMKKANGNKVRNLAVQENLRAGASLDLLLDAITNPPAYRNFEDGTENFPEVFDGLGKNSSVYSEMDRIAKSELAYCYLRFRDRDYGETLVLESQHSRGALTPLSSIYINDADAGFLKHRGFGSPGYLKHRGFGSSGKLKISEIEDVAIDRLQVNSNWRRGDYIVNKFTATDVSRKFDSSFVNLFNFDGRGDQLLVLGTGYVTSIVGEFSSPDERGVIISAKDIVTPVATTDYLFNSESDGSGSNLTANIIIISFFYGASSWTATVKNIGAPAYCTQWIVRGKGIYKDTNTDYTAENSESIDEIVREEREENIRREYSINRDTSKTFADGVVALNRVPQNSMRSVEFIVNTEKLMRAFMFLDIGNKVRIIESRPVKDGSFYIRGIKFSLHLGGTISFQWHIEEAVETMCQPIAIRTPISSTGKRVALGFGILPYLANLSQFSYSFWIKRTSPDHGPFGPIIGRSVDTGSGRRGNYLLISSELFTFISHKTPTDGRWDTGNIITSVDVWENIIFAYDNTTDTANPNLYLNNVDKTLTETASPSGTTDDDSDCALILFNIGPDPADPTQKYYYDVIKNFALKDVRIYDHILTSTERAAILAGEDDYATVPTGLLFQGIYAPKENIDDYIDDTIENDDFVLDAVNKAAGIPYNDDISSVDNFLYGLALT